MNWQNPLHVAFQKGQFSTWQQKRGLWCIVFACTSYKCLLASNISFQVRCVYNINPAGSLLVTYAAMRRWPEKLCGGLHRQSSCHSHFPLPRTIQTTAGRMLTFFLHFHFFNYSSWHAQHCFIFFTSSHFFLSFFSLSLTWKMYNKGKLVDSPQSANRH